MPTPATVFGMKATVTIATPNETIAGQTDGIAAEAGTDTMTGLVVAAAATPATTAPAATPTPATVFGGKTTAPAKPIQPVEEPVSEAAPQANAPANAVPETSPASDISRPITDSADESAQHDAPATATAPRQQSPAPSPTVSAAAAMRAIAAATMHVEPPQTKTAQPARIAPTGPTPAMMPQRRTSEGPTTFASLDAQELPVVREYSAGGLIFDDQNRVAIIARHSRSGHLEWCLPKGHIEKGETPQQTAVREVHEETGILGEVIDSIATIDYWFTGTTQRVHKLVHHFALRQTGGELTVEGDPDHEAEDAIWVRFDDLDDVLSYPNERKIAWLYAKKKNRQANE
ncbi:NUDIX hydrolase [Bifidobacterium cebidarum]